MGEDAESLKCREVLTNNRIWYRTGILVWDSTAGCPVFPWGVPLVLPEMVQFGSQDPLFRLHVSDLLPQL